MKPKKTVTTTETVEVDDAGERDADDQITDPAPLFSKDDAPDLAYVLVFRDEPIDEGMLPVRLDPSSTELDIARRFGGGVFRVQGRTSAGKPAKGAGMTQIKLAGTPIFDNPDSVAKYRRRLKQEQRADRQFDDDDDDQALPYYPPPPPVAPAGPSVSEIIALMSSQAQQASAIMIQMFQAQAQAQREQHARDLESENRRRQSELEMAREARDRDREFFGQVLAGLKPADGGNATSVLLEGLKLGAQLGGQAGGDPVTAAIENLPEILEAVRETGRAVQSENARGSGGKKGAGGADAAADEKLTLGGPLGKRALAMVAKWKAAGLDPEREMARLIEAGAGGASRKTPRALKPAPAPAKKNGAAGKAKPAPAGSA